MSLQSQFPTGQFQVQVRATALSNIQGFNMQYILEPSSSIFSVKTQDCDAFAQGLGSIYFSFSPVKSLDSKILYFSFLSGLRSAQVKFTIFHQNLGVNYTFSIMEQGWVCFLQISHFSFMVHVHTPFQVLLFLTQFTQFFYNSLQVYQTRFRFSYQTRFRFSYQTRFRFSYQTRFRFSYQTKIMVLLLNWVWVFLIKRFYFHSIDPSVFLLSLLMVPGFVLNGYKHVISSIYSQSLFVLFMQYNGYFYN